MYFRVCEQAPEMSQLPIPLTQNDVFRDYQFDLLKSKKKKNFARILKNLVDDYKAKFYNLEKLFYTKMEINRLKIYTSLGDAQVFIYNIRKNPFKFLRKMKNCVKF